MPSALAMAYDNLSSMLGAGVPVLRSLKTVSPGLKRRTKRAFLGVAEGVAKGNTLTETMKLHPRVFSRVDVMLVEVGEKSGNLPDMIGLLSKWHEMANRMVRKILAGLLFVGVILVAVAFIVPIPAWALGGWHTDVYFLSVARILLTFLVPAAILFLIIVKAPETGLVRKLLDRIVLRIPIFGRAMRNLALCRFCWAFHMLSGAGVPVSDCIDMSSSVSGNTVVGALFRPAVESVRAGAPMCEALPSELPLELVEMWKVGEETGKLDDVSKRLADKYGEAAEFWFGQFARWFPIFVYGLLCIYMIIRVFQGYSQLYSGISF
ncbi:MAG: type II secretion system F family protein [Planctomycetota bacterium]